MFESIRRAREIKKSETEFDPSRRNFLRGIAATAAISAIPTLLQSEIAEARTIEGDLGIRQREAMVDKAVQVIRAEMNSTDVREALEGKGDNLIPRMLRPLQSPIEASYVKGTKYDAEQERKRYTVQAAYMPGANGGNVVSFRSDRTGEQSYVKGRYGNGVFFGKAGRFLTAHHVCDDLLGRSEEKTRKDIGFLDVPAEVAAQPEQVIYDDTSLSNADIHGAFVSIEGIDPDATSTNGCKSYPGVAMRLDRGLVERVWKNSPPHFRERLAHSFVIALPPGEAKLTGDSGLASGMSGAPVFMYRNGKRVLAGIFHSFLEAQDPVTGRTVGLGFFHGIEEVREELGAHVRSGA